MQLPLFAPTSDWRPPNLDDLPQSWAGVRRIGIDTETCDPQIKQMGCGVRRDGFMVGVSIAFEDGPSYYLPFAHAETEDNLPKEKVLAYLRHGAKTFDGELVGAKLDYDLDYLWDSEIFFPQVEFYRDVQIADPLIYELHFQYSLQKISERWDLPGKDEELLRQAAKAYGVDPKGGMWRMPARFVGQYAEVDAERPLQLLQRQERKLYDDDLTGIWDLESKVLPVLVKMRQRGVRIDADKLEKVEQWSLEQEIEALNFVSRETGWKLSPDDTWKSEALGPALRAAGIPLEKTSKGTDSIRAEQLALSDNPVAKKVVWARKVNKLRTTFAASIRRYWIDGRIHCTFNQIAAETEGGDQKGVRYGRLSCRDPNLQQQPSRDSFAQDWRRIFLPEQGDLWCSDDYSQQEPRWTTTIAAMMNFEGARDAAKAYRDDPTMDNHDFMTNLVFQITAEDTEKDVWNKKRKQAKAIYLGLCYGEGGAKLCDDMGLPTRWAVRPRRGAVMFFESRNDALDWRAENEGGFMWRAAGVEGQNIIDKFNDRAPYIGKLAKKAKEMAEKRGWVKTIGGRKLHFPLGDDNSYDWTHKALNRIIQGTSADQMKRAIVEIDREGFHLMLQVHDEVALSVQNEKQGQEVGEIMSNALRIPEKDRKLAEVPFKVDVEIGESWGDSM